MMTLLFGQGAHAIHEVERLLEVGKGESASEVVLVDHAPFGYDLVQGHELLTLKRRHPTAAGDAFLVG